MDYEYKCVGAPERPRRSRRAKTPSDRVARAMETIIQEEAVNGWEYMRTDLVPVTEKSSFLGRAQEVHRAVLVFRRDLEARRAKSADRSHRSEERTDLFSDSATRRRSPGRRQVPAHEAPDPVETPPVEAPAVEAPAVTEPVKAAEERPRRARAVPAEEPIPLSADDVVGALRGRRGRDRSPPSGLG